MWTFDPNTRTTGDETGVIRRVQLDDAAERLLRAGFRNRRQIIDILKCLSDLSRGEVRASLELIEETDQGVCERSLISTYS